MRFVECTRSQSCRLSQSTRFRWFSRPCGPPANQARLSVID